MKIFVSCRPGFYCTLFHIEAQQEIVQPTKHHKEKSQVIYTYINILCITPVECLSVLPIWSLISWPSCKPRQTLGLNHQNNHCLSQHISQVSSSSSHNSCSKLFRKKILISPGSLGCASGYIRQQDQIKTCYFGLSSPRLSFPRLSSPLLSALCLHLPTRLSEQWGVSTQQPQTLASCNCNRSIFQHLAQENHIRNNCIAILSKLGFQAKL